MESMLLLLVAVLVAGAILLAAHYVMVRVGVDPGLRMLILGVLALGLLIYGLRFLGVW